MIKIFLAAVLCCLLLAGGALNGQAASSPKRIMVFGDSNSFTGVIPDMADVVERNLPTAVWPGKMSEILGSDYEVIVEAMGGRTTNIDVPALGSEVAPGAKVNGAAYLPKALAAHMPLDLVVIMLGTNDMRKDLDRDALDIARGVEELVCIIRYGTWRKKANFAVPQVLIISPPKMDLKNSPFAPYFEGSRAKSEALPGLLQALAKKHGVHFFNAASVVPYAQAADEIHLTPENHAILAIAVADEVKRILPVGMVERTQ